MKIRSQEPKIPKAIIEQFESEFGLQLHFDYKMFLLENNGGVPNPNTFDLEHFPGLSESQVNEFFGLSSPQESSNIDYRLKTFSALFPKGVVPIGHDDGGNFICISCRKDDFGSIYLLHAPYNREITDHSDLYLIAADFEKFLAALRPYESADIVENAFRKDDVAFIDRLLSQGHSLEERNEYGRTFLDQAVVYMSKNTIKYLLALGVEKTNAIAIAKQNEEFWPDEYREILSILESGK